MAIEFGVRSSECGIVGAQTLTDAETETAAAAGLRIALRTRSHPEEAKPTKDLSAAFLTELAGQSRRCSFQVHRRHDRGTVSCARGRLPSSAGSAGRERTIRESMYWNKYEIHAFEQKRIGNFVQKYSLKMAGLQWTKDPTGSIIQKVE